MVINYLHVLRTIPACAPLKTYAPLFVDPYAEPALAVTGESFEAVARQLDEVPKTRCCLKYSEALFSLVPEGLEPGDVFSVGQLPGSPITIAAEFSLFLPENDAVRQAYRNRLRSVPRGRS